MKYIIVRGNTIQEIETKVNEKLQEGWKPLGGVSVVPQSNSFDFTYYIQSMVYDV